MKPIADTLGQFRQTIKKLFRRDAVCNKRSYRPAFERMEERELLAAAFFAPAEPAGSVNVQLAPLANVTVGVPEVVTFGLPFTRGSVTAADLAKVRVLKGSVELPAFVEQLTPWRSIDNLSIDGQSVRVARIQIPYTFSALTPETITVQWGGPARTLNRPTLQDPRLEWHAVTSGTFVAADNVEEPDVLPVLPSALLAKGMLDARTDPTNSGVAETRDDPAVMDNRTFTAYQEYDYAQKNFFYSTINQNPGISIDYKTQSEPWLYDRSSAVYELYLRSGFATALREAVRNTDFYLDHIDGSGFFTLKPGDAKYAYNEGLAYTYWLVGDNKVLPKISTVVTAHNATASRWSPNLSFWTERNAGYKLLANQVAYEVTGNTTFKNNVQTIVTDLIWHQNGAAGQLPANRVDGGLYHTGAQHDISEASSGSVILASSWMSTLVVDPMVRVYGVWENSQVADFIVRMGNFEKAASKTDASGQFGGTTRYPDYLMRFNGTTDNRSDTDVQHAMDVGAVAAWATYFAELRGTPDASLRQLANDLYATYDVGVNFWTRPGGTNFNVSPPRRYAWEYKNSPSFSWALTATDAISQPGTLQFSSATYSVHENQSSVTITVNRSNGSNGTVTVNYATSNGTATAGSDYTATSGTLTFLDGETSKTFTIPIIDDTAVENPETVILTLSNVTGGATLGAQSTAVLTIDSDDTTNQPITITLQQGVNGYTGTTDVNISTQYAQYTGGNGTTTFDGTQLGVYQTTGTGSYTVESLIRFSNLGIPSNATVSGATLTLNVDTWTANPTIRGYYLLAPWSGTPGTNASQVGWIHRGNGQDWASPGARGQGGDVIAGKSFVLSGITATGAQTIVVNLDPAVVQSWISNPSANQGIVLVNESAGAIVRIGASENATAAARPKLSVTYTVGATTPQPGAVQFSNAAYAVNENDGTASITVTRTGGSNVAVTVNYATSNGTATAGSDYTATNGTLNFAIGETSKTFVVPILDDTAVEDPETVMLTLSNPTGGAVLSSPAIAMLTIISDDTTNQPITVTLQQGVNGYTGTTDVNISTQYAQYTGGNGTTTFDGTQLGVYQTTGTGSYTVESLIRFSNLGIPSNATVSGATLTLNVDTWTANPTIRGYYLLAPWSGTPGTNASQVGWIHRGNGQDWASPGARGQGSDAIAGKSFVLSGITATGGQTIVVNLDPAVVQSWISNPSANQGIVLVNESAGAIVRIGASENATAAARPKLSVTYTVGATTPQPGALQFSNAAYAVNENAGTATITVTRTGGSTGSVTVNYATSNGTATAGSDYIPASGTLTFADGEATKTFTVAVLDDTLVEGNETLTLTLSNPTGGATLGSPASATFTIVDNDSSSGVVLPTGFTQSVVATGISSGTALAVAPDGRIFVIEQGGAARIIKDGVLLATPAFTVATSAEQERGLLGIAFDPSFNTNQFVYVYYTVGGPSPSPAHNRVSRFKLNGDVAVPNSETVLIDLPDTTFRIHNGGALKFGADGKLYLAVGNDVTFGNSQDLTNPFGKILRINADGTIPSDNPFYNQTTGVNRAIWARGLRNPYTFDVQPGTGLMYINDVGEAAWEEINQGVAGGNYGWPNSEGYTTNPQYQSPVYAYAHGTGLNQGFAIAGAAFYNPATTTFPSQYVGKYFFMDYVNGWIAYVDPAAPNPKTPINFASNIPTRYDGGPVDLEVGTDGALYYLNRLGGGVFKIQYTAPPTGSFTKVNASSGIDGIIAQKYQEDPNWWLTGQHLVDLDNDGDLDLFLDAHNGTSVVALNDGHGVFTRLTTGSWPSSEIHQMYDINGDGRVDLAATYQDGGAQWWINNSTPGMVNFTATSVTRGGNTSRGQVMIDFNGDGKVDWLRSEQPGLVIDFGNGAGGFTAGSLSFPVAGTTTNNNANFLPADFDNDGDIDLLVITGGGYDGTLGKTAYWRNNGNLTFTDITASVGIPSNGIVVKGVGDFDQDGDIDFIAIENQTMPPVIYLNNGQGVFAKKANAISGVTAGSLDYSAWGTAVSTDFDNDGIADIIMNGKYYLKVLRGSVGGSFTYMNTAWGILDTAASAVDDGLCFGDIDGDGDLDIIGFNHTYPDRTLNVYRNDLAPKNWLNVRPVGLAGNVGAAGATISIYAAGTDQLLWYEQAAQYDFQVATSYYGYGKTERHFGLGSRANVDVVVRFPSGRVTRINNVAANQTIQVIESAGN